MYTKIGHEIMAVGVLLIYCLQNVSSSHFAFTHFVSETDPTLCLDLIRHDHTRYYCYSELPEETKCEICEVERQYNKFSLRKACWEVLELDHL